MNYNYSVEKKEGYLYLNISGEFEINQFLDLPGLMKIECEKEKVFKVLVNGFNIIGTNLSIIDRFSLGEKIAQILHHSIKVAILWPDKHNNKFAETVAVNRGANLRVFGKETEAKKWLLD